MVRRLRGQMHSGLGQSVMTMTVLGGLRASWNLGARPGTPPSPPATAWMASALVLAVALALAVILRFGNGEVGTSRALQATARLAFLYFWPAYVSGALVVLFGPRLGPVPRRARVLGLAFVSVLAVHLSLVAWLSWIGHAPALGVFVTFGAGVFCAGVLALASIDAIGRFIGSAGWWVLRTIAMNYLLLDFALDFFSKASAAGRHPLLSLAVYAPFQVLVVAAPALRVLAWLKQVISAA
jgi:hypothetical protein